MGRHPKTFTEAGIPARLTLVSVLLSGRVIDTKQQPFAIRASIRAVSVRPWSGGQPPESL